MFAELLAVAFLRPEIFGNGEGRHDRTVVDGIEFDFIGYFERVAQRFGHIRKDRVHLRRRFHPFLLGVTHAVRIIQVFARTEADQPVVRFGIFCIDEMDVVGCDYLYVVFFRQLEYNLVDCHLVGVGVLGC